MFSVSKKHKVRALKPKVSPVFYVTVCPLEPNCLWISLQSREPVLSQEWPQEMPLCQVPPVRRRHVWSHPRLTCRQGGMLLWPLRLPFLGQKEEICLWKKNSCICFSFPSVTPVPMISVTAVCVCVSFLHCLASVWLHAPECLNGFQWT